MILRIDDLGASSKLYERHRLWSLRPYPEMTHQQITDLAHWLGARGWAATLAITACWVERDGALTEYPRKFPQQAAAIHYWASRGVFEVACHGLTHCVPGRHVRPWWGLRSNRPWHREYIDAIPLPTQQEYLRRAKQILEDRFCARVGTFVPPGNAISPAMVDYALDKLGFETVTCRVRESAPLPRVLDDRAHVVLHDRDLVTRGLAPLEEVQGPTVTVASMVSCLRSRQSAR